MPRAVRPPHRPSLAHILGIWILGIGLATLGPVHASDTGRQVLEALKRGVRSPEAAVRQRAALDVGRYSGHLDPRQKKRAGVVLHKALKDEVDADTRRVFVRALAQLHTDSAWMSVIRMALQDPDPDVKATARLEVFRDRRVVLGHLTELIRQETSASYKAQLVFLLRDRRRHDAVPLLIELLRDKQGIVRAAAAESLEAISGEAHGFHPGAWKAWHQRWLAARPEPGSSGPSVAPEDVEPTEPPPHITRSLHPSFYGIKLTAKDLVFVVDISGSVGEGGVKTAKKHLRDAVALLGSDVHMSAIFFSETVQYWNQGRMVRATPENKEKLLFYLKSLDPGRKSDVYTAFNAGLAILKKRLEALEAAKQVPAEPAALLAVSDGADNVGGVPLHVIEDRLDRLDMEHTVVHAIVLGGRGSKVMRMLATYGGGHYVLVPKGE